MKSRLAFYIFWTLLIALVAINVYNIVSGHSYTNLQMVAQVLLGISLVAFLVGYYKQNRLRKE